MKIIYFALLIAGFGSGCAMAATEPAPIVQTSTSGTSVSYQLPATGPLPQTYRVTLAITDPKNPDWIVSQFAAGGPRTVTAKNGGKFTEKWNGLDDNFLPLPPGQYGIKGIYMPAKKWAIDGEYHSIVPRFLNAADAWRALPGESKSPVIWGRTNSRVTKGHLEVIC